MRSTASTISGKGFMCAGDTALEGPDREPEAGMSLLRGWGVKHPCRDWAALVEWIEGSAAVVDGT